MKNYVIVAVLAYSLKKDMGWLKLASIDGRAWGDLGAHFDKDKFGSIFNAPGLYKIDFVNKAGFGENAKYQVVEAEKVGSFEELIELAENAA